MKILVLLLSLLCGPAFAQGGTMPGPGTPHSSGGAWTPASLPGLVAWYKADNDSTNIFSDSACTTPQTTNAGLIKCWKDKSGNGYHLINVNSAPALPAYTLAGLNSKPTVTFAATTWLATAAGVAMGTGNAISGFFDMQFTATNNNQQVFAYSPPGSTGTSSGGTSFIVESGATLFFRGLKNNISTSTVAMALNTPNQFGFVADGTNEWSYLANSQGSPAVAVTNANISAGTFLIGAGNSNGATTGSFFSGTMSEIVITNNAISGTDLTSLQTYLSGRW